MKRNEKNFIEYLGTEEHNLLASLNNFRSEFDLFSTLDRIYQEPLSRLNVEQGSAVVPQLYLFVHFHLYFSMSCILRSHLSECLASVRKAIDASFSAYKIILEPETSGKYENGESYFKYIKTNLKNEINKEPSKYPLAKTLINIHEACSEFGAHADSNSFFHRLGIKDIPNTDQCHITVQYFQYPKNSDEYQFYLLVTIQSFHMMFLIFKLFLDENLRIIDPVWENAIKEIGPTLERLRQEAFNKMQNH